MRDCQKKNFQSIRLSASLNENIRLLNLILPPDKRHFIKTILLSENKNIAYKFHSNIKTLNNCSIANVGNDRIIV